MNLYCFPSAEKVLCDLVIIWLSMQCSMNLLLFAEDWNTLFFIYRDTLSVSHPNTTNIKFTALIKKVMWISSFFFSCDILIGFEKYIYSLTPLHNFSFMCFPLAKLWLSATADLCKQVHVPVMGGMNLCSEGLFFIAAVHQSLVVPGTYRNSKKRLLMTKQAEL